MRNPFILGIPAHKLKNTVYELLRGIVGLKETIIKRNGLSLVPSSPNLYGAEIEFSGMAGREFRKKYDKEYQNLCIAEKIAKIRHQANLTQDALVN